MLHDIEPYQFFNEYHPQAPEAQDYLLCFKEKEVLIKWQEGGIDFPRFTDLDGHNKNLKERCRYLFTIDKQRFYLAAQVHWPEEENYSLENIEVFRKVTPKHLAFAGITGAQLFRWYEANRYCGKCQTEMVHSDKERMVYCPKCGHVVYPKISPAVIVGITNGNRILLSKYANRDFKKYALIAGFTEIGESIEDTVRREVMEEVGLKVKNLKYYKSQPWSFTDTLLFGFFAELDGEEGITLDREELAMAQWFEREEIPVEETNLSLTNEMIIKFKRNEI